MDLGISKLVWSIVEKDVTFLQSIVCVGVHELVNVERGLIKRVFKPEPNSQSEPKRIHN